MVSTKGKFIETPKGRKSASKAKTTPKNFGAEWSEWDERHGRWVGIATREECLAVSETGVERRQTLK